MVPVAIVTGLLIGLSLGTLGGGGSILTVPVLVYLLGQDPHQATTASLLVVGLAAVIGAVTHARAGRARVRTGLIFGLLGMAGAYAGSLASAAVPANLLLAGFGLLMLAVAAAMILRHRMAGRPRPSGHHPRPGTRRAVAVVATATGVGLITGFFGVGGGFVVVPALVLVLGFDMAAAAGTSLIVIAIDSASALAARAGHAMTAFDWGLIAAFATAAVLGTLAGTTLAGRVRPQQLSGAFTALIILVAGFTLVRSIPRIAV